MNLWVFIGLFLLLTAGIRLILAPVFFKRMIGLGLVTHALNILLLLSGSTPPQEKNLGHPAFLKNFAFEEMIDPLPQALILTAIVISFGVTAFFIFFHLIGERESKT